jgi:hypothetical protein
MGNQIYKNAFLLNTLIQKPSTDHRLPNGQASYGSQGKWGQGKKSMINQYYSMRAATLTTKFPHPTSHNQTWHATLDFFCPVFHPRTAHPEAGIRPGKCQIPASRPGSDRSGRGRAGFSRSPASRTGSDRSGRGKDSRLSKSRDAVAGDLWGLDLVVSVAPASFRLYLPR